MVISALMPPSIGMQGGGQQGGGPPTGCAMSTPAQGMRNAKTTRREREKVKVEDMMRGGQK